MMEVNLKYTGLKVKHIQHVAAIGVEDNIKKRAEVLANVLGVNKEVLYRIDNLSFNSLWSLLIKDLEASISYKRLNNVIEVAGKRYKFIDPLKQSVGWYIDATNLKLNPETLMALCYIEEEAKRYDDVDDNGQVKYHVLEREKAMLEADLKDYNALSAFFLSEWKHLMKKMEVWHKIELIAQRLQLLTLANGVK